MPILSLFLVNFNQVQHYLTSLLANQPSGVISGQQKGIRFDVIVVKTECLHGVSSRVVQVLRQVHDPKGNVNA